MIEQLLKAMANRRMLHLRQLETEYTGRIAPWAAPRSAGAVKQPGWRPLGRPRIYGGPQALRRDRTRPLRRIAATTTFGNAGITNPRTLSDADGNAPGIQFTYPTSTGLF